MPLYMLDSFSNMLLNSPLMARSEQLTGLKVRCEREAEVRICHNHRDAGLTLECNNQPGAGQDAYRTVQ